MNAKEETKKSKGGIESSCADKVSSSNSTGKFNAQHFTQARSSIEILARAIRIFDLVELKLALDHAT